VFEERDFAEAAGLLLSERIDSHHLKDETSIGSVCRSYVLH
jgi:hypothetical protein